MAHHTTLKRLGGALILGILFVGIVFVVLLTSSVQVGSAAPIAQQVDDPAGDTSLSASLELTHHIYLPLGSTGYGPRSYRVGYCATNGTITRYPDVGNLAAGWYVNFHTETNPPRPSGMEYVQMIRLHQMTACWPQRLRNRSICPYVDPPTYTLTYPNTRGEIVEIAQAQPGSLWLIGNEMDRYDWGDPSRGIEEGGQDEMTPALYAQAYHELYHLIKGTDPTAQVAIGGIIQATPARLEYLTKIWDKYQQYYGTDIPVDVWNVHNFIFKEKCDDFGADVPPGYDGCYGKLYLDEKHDNMEIFDEQIRAFRQWMKDHGQQYKPLIVSEYGIIYSHAGMNDPQRVQSFMLGTFDYFMNTVDPQLGYAPDDYRLVQRWAWYSLDDSRGTYNDYAYLINHDTLQMSSLGQAFAGYTMSHLDSW